jgi:hypothetical protein
MEQQGAIVCHEARDGRRIVALPALGRETAPGDADAASQPHPPGSGDLFATG